jgi:hypothetical protein
MRPYLSEMLRVAFSEIPNPAQRVRDHYSNYELYPNMVEGIGFPHAQRSGLQKN